MSLPHSKNHCKAFLAYESGEGHLRSRGYKCQNADFGHWALQHMFLGQFFVKNAKSDHKTSFFLIKIGENKKSENRSEYIEITWKVAVSGIQMALQRSFLKISTSNFGTQIHLTRFVLHIYSGFFKMFKTFVGMYDKLPKFWVQTYSVVQNLSKFENPR